MTILRVDTIAGTGTTFGPLLDGNLEFNSQNYIILPKGTSSQEGVLRNTVDVVGTGGTYYDNLVLAMPFNEATGLTDISSRNRNPGAYGNVAISTAQSKYYGSSAYFDGSGDYIIIEDNSDFVFGTGDFTFETWAYFSSSATGNSVIFDQREKFLNGPYPHLWYDFTNKQLNYYVNSFNVLQTGVNSVNYNTWYHITLVRYSGNTKIYVNGIQKAGTYVDANNYLNNSYGFYIGISVVDAAPMNGHLQDLRIYKGIAKYTANFTPPERIAETGVGFKTGQLRYNTDSNKVELYDGNQWAEVQSSRPDLNGGARGVFGGGVSNVIDYVNISSTGNAQDFGDLLVSRYAIAACSSNTRGLFGGGGGPTTNLIDYITISSTGNAQDFGDLFTGRYGLGACSSNTRGVFGGGFPPFSNLIDYVTIASTGNAQDFGDLTQSRGDMSACSSSTRGIFAGGNGPSNIIDFITISTLGNAQDFGDLTQGRRYQGMCSNATRALFGGGFVPTATNSIEFITTSTLGNAVKFGDLTLARQALTACSSPTRGLFAGGYTPVNNYNIIDYITILTQGNAIDFGDLTVARNYAGACSNAHGGL